MAENKDHPDIRILPPVLMLIFIAAAFVLNWLVPLPVPAEPVVRIVGWALLILGFALGFSALRELTRAGTSPVPHEPTTAVVTSGVYTFTRNPIYLGFLLTIVGLPLAFGNPWGLLLIPVAIPAFNMLVIQHEEAYLHRKFGSAYAAYTERVRRWL